MQHQLPAVHFLFVLEPDTASTIARNRSLAADGVYSNQSNDDTADGSHINIVHRSVHIQISEHCEHKEHHHDITQTHSDYERNRAFETIVYTILYQREECRAEAKKQRQRNTTDYANK